MFVLKKNICSDKMVVERSMKRSVSVSYESGTSLYLH